MTVDITSIDFTVQIEKSKFKSINEANNLISLCNFKKILSISNLNLSTQSEYSISIYYSIVLYNPSEAPAIYGDCIDGYIYTVIYNSIIDFDFVCDDCTDTNVTENNILILTTCILEDVDPTSNYYVFKIIGTIQYNPTIDFNNDRLAEIVKKELQLSGSTVYASDMLVLYDLIANNIELSDLSFLKYAINISYLDLSSNDISILPASIFATLIKLRYLNLNQNHISDLTPLAPLVDIADVRL